MTQILLNWLLVVLAKILYYLKKNPNKELYCQYSCANMDHSQGIMTKTVNWTNHRNILQTDLKGHCDDANDEHFQLGNILFFFQKACCCFVYLSFFSKSLKLTFLLCGMRYALNRLVSSCSIGTSQQEK